MNDSMVLLIALLHTHPHIPEPMRSCLDSHRDRIVAQAQEGADQNDVPAGVLLTVGFLESHLGCHPRSGGCWGAPIDPTHRLTAGTHHHAAVALATSYRVCGTWEGAISRFRCGLCRCPAPRTEAMPVSGVCAQYWRPVRVGETTLCRQARGYNAAFAVRMIENLYAAAGITVPEHLYSTPPQRRPRH